MEVDERFGCDGPVEATPPAPSITARHGYKYNLYLKSHSPWGPFGKTVTLESRRGLIWRMMLPTALPPAALDTTTNMLSINRGMLDLDFCNPVPGIRC